MSFKELFKKYKTYTIVGIIVLLILIAGGTTAGVLLTKQDKEQINNSANAAVGSTFTLDNLRYRVLTEGTTNTVEIYDTTSISISGAIEIPSQVSNGGINYIVTSIDTYAFRDCINLTSITIPDSVTSIGDYAFSGCSSLSSITIPDSVTSIGNSAFSYCSGLTEITIPDSVTEIGGSALYSCYSLTNVYYAGDINDWVNIDFSSNNANPLYYADNLYLNGNTSMPVSGAINIDTATTIKAYSLCGPWLRSVMIGNQVTSIGDDAFYNCSGLTSINVDTNNANYMSSNGVLFNKTQTELIKYPASKSGTSYSIPSSVASIGNSAFDGCSGLTSVYYAGDINDWVSIDFGNQYANPLYYADNLYLNGQTSTPYEFPSDLDLSNATKIGSYSLYGQTGITSVTIGNQVTSIGRSAFSFCSGLTSITIPNSVTSIGDAAFSSCNSLISMTIPNSVTSIGSTAFRNCRRLTSITIPESVTSIGVGAFFTCSGLTSVYFSGNINDWVSIDFGDNTANPLYCADNLYLNGNTSTPTTSINIDTATTIRAYSLCGTWLQSVVIGNQVTSIGESAFEDCSGLTSVTIPDSVTSIGERAFYYCSGLNNVYFYNDISTDASSIGNYAFDGSSTVTYWVKDQTSLTNIQAIYNASSSKFSANNFQIMSLLTINCDESLGQIFVNGQFTTNYNEVITGSGITLSNVIALPKANCAFLYWLVTTESGSKQVTDNPLSMTITETTTITAVFSNSLMDGIGVTAIGGGQVRMGGYDGNIDSTTQVTLNAVCYSGYTFDGWYTMENGALTKIDALGNFTAVTINVTDYDGKLIIARFIPNSNGNINDDVNN